MAGVGECASLKVSQRVNPLCFLLSATEWEVFSEFEEGFVTALIFWSRGMDGQICGASSNVGGSLEICGLSLIVFDM